MSKKRKAAPDGECCVCFNTIIGKAGKLPCGHDKLCVDCIIKVFTQMDVKCPICRWVPPSTSREEECSFWTMATADRLALKCTDTSEKLKWMSDGLRIFGQTTPKCTATLCIALSRQLHETDNDED